MSRTPKLSNSEIIEIYFSKEKSLYLSLKYNVNESTIWRIKRRKYKSFDKVIGELEKVG